MAPNPNNPTRPKVIGASLGALVGALVTFVTDTFGLNVSESVGGVIDVAVTALSAFAGGYYTRES